MPTYVEAFDKPELFEVGTLAIDEASGKPLMPRLPVGPNERGTDRPTREATEGELWQATELLEPQHCAFPEGQVLSRSSGMPCRCRKLRGKTRCRFHGGRNKTGSASPTFKHGRYSNNLSPALLERYTRALGDDEFLALRDEIAIVSARIQELLERIGVSGGRLAWRQIQALVDAAIAARVEGEDEASADLMEKARVVCVEASHDEALWPELVDLLERKAKITQIEWQRQVKQKEVLTRAEAFELVGAILKIITNRVSDRKEMAAVHTDIQALLGHEQVQTVQALPSRK